MTAYTVQTLIPFLQYGNVSGSYAGGSVYVGNAVPAANYYGGQGFIQTIFANVSGFQGNISVQATLNDAQESAPWFEISNVIAANVSNVFSNAITGNFTWLRAVVTDYSAGNINIVTASY
jgi:hypothetical protein